jgi:hypothetical protein
MTDTYRSDHADDHDDPDSTGTLVIGILGSIVLFVIVVLIQVMLKNEVEKERYRKQIIQAPAALEQYRADQEGRLNSYGWVSQPDGIVHVPIERAMDLVVREQSPRVP